MAKRGKKYIEARKQVDPFKRYGIDEAIELAKKIAFANFDETLEVAVRLGVDPRHADQMVRGSVLLPYGTGKSVKVLVFAKGEKEKEAKEAGADYVGGEDMVDKIVSGWLDFDKAVATPDMMRYVSKIGKILGPRGLMPNPKAGTVTFDVGRVVKELKKGRIEFRVDKTGIIHVPVGKLSFPTEHLVANIQTLMDTIIKLKPASSKGVYIRGIAISSSMGPGIKVDPSSVKSAVV